MSFAYAAMRSLVRPALRRGFRWTIEGEDHIPGDGAAILAANHISHLDPLCLSYVADRRGRRVRFLAKAELFEHRLLGAVLRAVGDIPVEPGAAGHESFSAAAAALGAGEALGIFPEGAISRDLEPAPAHTGVARLARQTGAPVVPVGLWGGHRVSTRGRRRRWRPGAALVVTVGSPVTVGPEEDHHAATDRIMAAVRALVSDARQRNGESRNIQR